MSGFKFDKNNEELDLSLGSDDALGAGATKKPSTSPKQQLPKPSIPQPKTNPKTPVNKPAPTTPKTLPPKPTIKPKTATVPPVQTEVTTPKTVPVANTTPEELKVPVENIPPVTPPPVEQEKVVTQPPLQPTPPPLPDNKNTEEKIPYVPEIEPMEEVVPVPKKQPRPPIPQNTSRKTERNTKNSRKKGNNSFTGNRKVVLGIRITAGAVAAIVIFAGLNSILFPPNFPSPNQVIAKVKEGLNITEFPTQKATGFVIDFVEAYFTVDPENYSSRDDNLSQYVSDNVLEETDLVFNRSVIDSNSGQEAVLGQSIIGVPAIVSTYSIDDNNAVFTVQVALSTGTTMYVDIPVYWNPENNGMAVSAPLSLVPAIGLTQIPQDNLLEEWANDREVVDAFEADLKKYLEAWALSDKTSISRYTTDKATLMAKLGLGGTVKLERLEMLEVQGITEETVDPAERNARIDVVWKDANNEAFTYKQSYMLVIKQKPDQKWYVDNINSVVIK